MGKRAEVRRENKDINRPVLFNRINFMAVYLMGIYLPNILYLSVKFDIAEISLSRIGWRMDGFPFLLVYCGLTIPFMLFEAFSYSGYLLKGKGVVRAAFIVVCAILCGGVFFPYGESDPEIFLVLHRITGTIGAIVLLTVTAYLLFSYCAVHKIKKTLCICINVFYLIFFGLMVQAFFTTGTTAIFETASTYINMVILFALNLFESRSRACY